MAKPLLQAAVPPAAAPAPHCSQDPGTPARRPPSSLRGARPLSSMPRPCCVGRLLVLPAALFPHGRRIVNSLWGPPAGLAPPLLASERGAHVHPLRFECARPGRPQTTGLTPAPAAKMGTGALKQRQAPFATPFPSLRLPTLAAGSGCPAQLPLLASQGPRYSNARFESPATLVHWQGVHAFAPRGAQPCARGSLPLPGARSSAAEDARPCFLGPHARSQDPHHAWRRGGGAPASHP
jgi:hypothetical protein